MPVATGLGLIECLSTVPVSLVYLVKATLDALDSSSASYARRACCSSPPPARIAAAMYTACTARTTSSSAAATPPCASHIAPDSDCCGGGHSCFMLDQVVKSRLDGRRTPPSTRSALPRLVELRSLRRSSSGLRPVLQDISSTAAAAAAASASRPSAGVPGGQTPMSPMPVSELRGPARHDGPSARPGSESGRGSLS